MSIPVYYKSPLSIYVVWHPANEDGLKYAEQLYNAFCRDIMSPLTRGLSIPVYFRYLNAPNSNLPLPVDLDFSIRTAIVLLADEKMFEDEAWSAYVGQLLNLESINNRVFPVALSSYAFHIDEKRLTAKQFVTLFKIGGNDNEDIFHRRSKELRSRLLHDLSRFFYKMDKVAEEEVGHGRPPVKLFISHAKHDGEELAIRFRNYVQSRTKLKTFFDVNDIADAENFENEIKNSLKNSAIVVFLSDLYSTREWCRVEVIIAKRNQSPLVIVNNLKKGERRSFPYLGNTPTIRYQKNAFSDIIDLALYQVLNNLFFEEKLKEEIRLHDLEAKYTLYRLENAPELFNYIDIKRVQMQKPERNILVLYPDPPLGSEEINLLNELDPAIKFVTPSFMFKMLGNGI